MPPAQPPPAVQRQPATNSPDRLFEHLLADYHLVSLGMSDHERADNPYVQTVERIVTRLQAKPRSVLSGDYMELERAVLMLLPADDLRRRAWRVRERYQSVVGAATYKTYLESAPPVAADTPDGQLRSDLAQVIEHIHWQYATTSYRERQHQRIVYNIAWGLGVAAVVVLALLVCDLWKVWPGWLSFVSLVPAMGLAGAVGAYFSLINRFKNVDAQTDPILSSLSIEGGSGSIYLSPFSGTVFALLAYLLMVSGLLQTNFTPHLIDPDDTSALPVGTLVPAGNVMPASVSVSRPYWAVPRSAGDLARLLILCFVAGFAERWLPDSLDRLIGRKLANFAGLPPPAPPPAKPDGPNAPPPPPPNAAAAPTPL